MLGLPAINIATNVRICIIAYELQLCEEIRENAEKYKLCTGARVSCTLAS